MTDNEVKRYEWPSEKKRRVMAWHAGNLGAWIRRKQSDRWLKAYRETRP